MYLNADIVCDNLPADLKANMSGPKDITLSLKRPELYVGGNAPFESHRLYLVDADRIPARAPVGRGCVIVSIGDSLRLERYRERCSVIVVSRDADFYRTFNVLQSIFDAYDEWENDLHRTVEEGGDIEQLLTRSEAVFGNPLYAIDDSFRILGISDMARQLDARPDIRPNDGGSLRLGAFDQFLELHDLSMDEREPLVLTLLDQTTLNYNLFEADSYRGCLTVHYTQRNYRQSDKPLVAFLGSILLLATRQLADRAPEGLGSLRQALQGLVEERPLDAIERDIVDASNNGRRFVCMRMKLSNQLEQLPLGFVRNAVENAFARSIVFEYHRNSVVAVIDVDTLGDGDYCSAIARGIEPFTRSMEMKAGFSNVYDDLVATRSMFQQADRALDIGMLFEPGESLYSFADFELRSMVMAAVSETRLELLFPEGLKRLVEHDRDAPTSYVETLRAYLNNNASIAKTANELFVHRSTLIERLARIKRELDIDLDDPDERLMIHLLLKAMQTRDELRIVRERHNERPRK